MNAIEKYRLKKLLKTEVEDLRKISEGTFINRLKDLAHTSACTIVDDDIALNFEDGHHCTTAEIIVFSLNKNLLYELTVAYMGFETLIGTREQLNDETNRLIYKARAICPPATHYVPRGELREIYDDQQWYIWFASEFMGLPDKQAYNYYAKRHINSRRLSRG